MLLLQLLGPERTAPGRRRVVHRLPPRRLPFARRVIVLRFGAGDTASATAAVAATTAAAAAFAAAIAAAFAASTLPITCAVCAAT